MALFALAPLPPSSPIPTDVDILMREMTEEIVPLPRPSSVRPSDQSDTGEESDTFPPSVRPKRLQELAGPSRVEQSPRKGSNASVASSKFSVQTDDQSYATARESMSEAESSEYHTAREGMSTSDSVSTLKSEGGDVRQIESDAESVFSAVPEEGLFGSRQTLLREDSLEPEVRSLVEREATPVNESRTVIELTETRTEVVSSPNEEPSTSKTVESIEETVTVVKVEQTEKPVPSPRTSVVSPTPKVLPASCNMDEYNEEIDATLDDMIRSMPVIQPETYQLSDHEEPDDVEVLEEAVAKAERELLSFGSAPEVQQIGPISAVQLPRSDSMILEDVIRNVERTNEEMRLLIEEERILSELDRARTRAPEPDSESQSSEAEALAHEQRVLREVEEIIQREERIRAAVGNPIDNFLEATKNESLLPRVLPHAHPSVEAELERITSHEEDIRSVPNLHSRSSRRSITVESPVDRKTFEDMLGYHTPTSPEQRRLSASSPSSTGPSPSSTGPSAQPRRQSSYHPTVTRTANEQRRQSSVVYATTRTTDDEETIRREELELNAEMALQEGSPSSSSPYPGEFLRRFIAERDRDRRPTSRRPQGLVLNPDSPEFVRQMAEVISQDTDRLFTQERTDEDVLQWSYPSSSGDELLLRSQQAVIERSFPEAFGQQQREFLQTREYERVDESGATVRTVKEERLTVETRTIIRSEDGDDEYTQEVTSSKSFGEPQGGVREELSERVTRVVLDETDRGAGASAEEKLSERVEQLSPQEDEVSHALSSSSSLNDAAGVVVDDAVQQALAELRRNENGSPTSHTAEEIESVSASTAARPTNLFGVATDGSPLASPTVSFSHNVPIVETPSTHLHPHTPGQESGGHRSPSPVELTEEQPEYDDESLAETEVEAVVEEPLSRKGSVLNIEEGRTRSLSGGSAKSETASSVVDPHLHHEASDIFDMNHQVPGRRERTPDPTPELPEEKAWTKADFRPGMGMGSRQYSESEFSEAELRDLARRGSEVSIGEVFQRPKSPEPPGSSSPALAESEPAAAVNIHLLVTPEDEETTFLQPLDDILEEKESSSGESDRFQQRRDVVSSASGSLQEFERLEAETSGGGAGGGGGGNGGGPQKPVPHDTESLSSLTEFERLEQQAAVEEEVAFRSPEAESMTHSESMSSGTASTVVEQGRDEDVQSQHTDRDVMGESLDEPEFLHRLSPRQPDIMTDSLDGRSMTESFSMARPRGEQGISDVLMTDSLESEGMRRVLGSNIMADSLVEEELLGHLQGTGEEIQIPPAETVPESKGATVVVRRYLVTGHPTLQTATFTNLDAMQDFLAENQSQYPEMNLQIYESMEEHTDNETEEHDRAVTTTRIVKRRRSDLKESVETVTFTGTDSSHEMAKFLSRTMPLDYNETETVECETRDETGDVTRMMTRRLSRVDTGNAAAAGGALTGRGSGSGSRLLLRQMSSTSSSIPDIPERSPNTDLPPGDAQASHSTGLAALAAHSIDSLRQDVTESSQHEANTETEILEETVVTTVTTDDPSIEEEGAEEIDLTEHDVKEQQKRMEGSR